MGKEENGYRIVHRNFPNYFELHGAWRIRTVERKNFGLRRIGKVFVPSHRTLAGIFWMRMGKERERDSKVFFAVVLFSGQFRRCSIYRLITKPSMTCAVHSRLPYILKKRWPDVVVGEYWKERSRGRGARMRR
jgi:hypothetical protein